MPSLPGRLHSVPLTWQQSTVDPCLHWRLLDTPRQFRLSLLWSHYSFLLGPGVHKVLFVPSKSLTPQSCGSSIIESHWPQIPWVFSVHLPDRQLWKSFLGPRTFATVWKLLWYNCSPVCRLSAQQFYGGLMVMSSKRTCATWQCQRMFKLLHICTCLKH